MHQRFKKMIIDEQKEEFDLSDHNMLTAIFTLENNDHNQFKDNIYNHRKDVLMSKWNTYKHMQYLFADDGNILMKTRNCK